MIASCRTAPACRRAVKKTMTAAAYVTKADERLRWSTRCWRFILVATSRRA